MEADYRILVMTSDKYMPAIKVFAYLLNKYWQPTPRVIVSGFSKPTFDLPDNFTFFSAGNQVNFPFDKWSDALYITLAEAMQDEVFILMLEDYWLIRQCNAQAVQLCVDYARSNADTLKVDLCTDRLYAWGADLNYGYYDYLDLIKSSPDSPYQMSLMPGVWRNDNLLGVLVPNESPHTLEMEGTSRLAGLPTLNVIGTRQFPLHITLGLRARDHTRVNLDELQQQDVNFLRLNGYLKFWNM